MSRRRTFLSGMAVAAILVTGSTVATMSTSAYASANCVEHLETVAYLGGHGHAPEMTDAALENARAQSSNHIQVDVRVTADWVPVLVRDRDLKRTTDVEKVFPAHRHDDPVSSFTFAELQKLDAGSWYDKAFASQKILPLHDLLEYVYPEGVGVSITPKDAESTPGLMEALIEELRKDPRWSDLLSLGFLEFSSPDLDVLETLNANFPEAKILWAPATLPDDAVLNEQGRWVDTIGHGYRDFEPADAVSVHQAGMTAALYDVDSPSAMTRAIGSGADKIFTGFPDMLTAICADRNPMTDANGIEVSAVVAAVDGSDTARANGEYVTLTNHSNVSIDVSGYYIRTASSLRLEVGEGYILAPDDSVKVYTGPGTDTSKRFYNGKDINVLNNTQDTLTVYSASNKKVAMFSY